MCRRCEGLTLVECLVAVGLLVAVSLGTVQLLVFTLGRHLIARHQLVMGVVAATKLDELSSAIASGAVVTAGADSVAESGRTYLRQWQIADVPGYEGQSFAITVRVAPASGAGGELRVVTIRAVSGP